MVVGLQACPYTKSIDVSAVGLEAQGVVPGPVGYRYSPTTDACMAMSMFWNCICEMMSESEANLSSIMLSLPGIGMGDGVEAHNRFAGKWQQRCSGACSISKQDLPHYGK